MYLFYQIHKDIKIVHTNGVPCNVLIHAYGLDFSMALSSFPPEPELLFKAEGPRTSSGLQMVLVWCQHMGRYGGGTADVRRSALEHWIRITGKVLRLQLVKKKKSQQKDAKLWKSLCKDDEKQAQLSEVTKPPLDAILRDIYGDSQKGSQRLLPPAPLLSDLHPQPLAKAARWRKVTSASLGGLE